MLKPVAQNASDYRDSPHRAKSTDEAGFRTPVLKLSSRRCASPKHKPPQPRGLQAPTEKQIKKAFWKQIKKSESMAAPIIPDEPQPGTGSSDGHNHSCHSHGRKAC